MFPQVLPRVLPQLQAQLCQPQQLPQLQLVAMESPHQHQYSQVLQPIVTNSTMLYQEINVGSSLPQMGYHLQTLSYGILQLEHVGQNPVLLGLSESTKPLVF